ncbi:MAG: hypothetical protein JXA41_08980 [Deltaproteobacteria bacterium]|nr:hypothetical protein [Deltaproteobacteria bacterium]
MSYFRRYAFLMIFLLSIFITILACGVYGTKIELMKYSPHLTGDLSDYHGKKIYLMNFDNQAQNTSVWYYYSRDKKFTYGGDSLINNYFWYAFRNAMVNLGMEVSKVDRPDPHAPGMWMTMKSFTDEQFVGQVNLQKYGNPFFVKIYTITSEPLAPGEQTPANMEMRAYDMTNKLVEAILTDHEFKHAFFKAESEMAYGR